MRVWVIAIIGSLASLPTVAAEPFDVGSISCESSTHSFNTKICAYFEEKISAVPKGVEIAAQLNDEVLFSCRAVEELGALQRRITASISRSLRDLRVRPTLTQHIAQTEFLARLRSFPYARRRAIIRIEVPAKAFGGSSEGIVDVVVQAGSRSARMTVAARGAKTIVQRGMIVSKTEHSLVIKVPIDTTALCYSRRIFVWSQTYFSNSIVFGFEITWEELINLIDSVPNLGAVR